MTKREELISKYERNKTLMAEFRKIYKDYLDKTSGWDKLAMFDSKITNRQYYNELVRVSDQEYSEAQYRAIKTVVIQDQFLDGYISGVDNQYQSLSLLYEDLKRKMQ